MENAIFGSQAQSLGCLELFSVISRTISSSAQSSGNSIYMKFEHKKNIQPKLICPFLQQKTLGFTTLSTIVIMLKPKKRRQFRFCKIQQNVKLGRLTENVEL